MESFIYNKFCISSTSGSGGKTILSLGLARLLYNKGYLVKPFKKGPDYIDSRWLSLSANCQATNLDLYLVSKSCITSLFYESIPNSAQDGHKSPVALLEGNRGIFDGLDEEGSCSTAELCKLVQCPVILSLDCTKMTRTVLAILQGIINFDKNLKIIGVVLNKIGSSRHGKIITSLIQRHTNLQIFGILPRIAPVPLPERHMGLNFSQSDDHNTILENLAVLIRENINWQTILESTQFYLDDFKENHGKNKIAREESSISFPAKFSSPDKIDTPKIGYVMDDILWFYYPENLQAIRNSGGELIKLSLLDESKKNIDNWLQINALYLGGGFPEEFLRILANHPILNLINKFGKNNMPIYAECGGFMLLAKGLRKENEFYPLADLIPATIQWNKTPQGIGYVEAEVLKQNPFFLTGSRMRGHEFHYSSCLMEENAGHFSLGLFRGKGIKKNEKKDSEILAYDGYCKGNIWGAYMHIFAPSVPCWSRNLVRLAQKYARSAADGDK